MSDKDQGPAKEAPVSAATEQLNHVSFDYLKGNLFRAIHADGVIGGITPSRCLHIAFFNERGPIPQQQTFSIKSDGTLGEEIQEARVSRTAVIREMEVDVIMTLATAKKILRLLERQVADLEKLESDPVDEPEGQE